MTRDRELLISIRADVRNAVNQMRTMREEVGRTGQAGPRAARGLGQLTGQMRMLVSAASAYISLRLVREITRQADAYAVLTRRIRTAAEGMGDHIVIQRRLEEIARRHGNALEGIVDQYQNLARIAPEIGATADQLLTIVDTVQGIGKISGAADGQIASGMQQLTLALTTGEASSRELQSILRQFPELANRIARGLGMTVGELRNAVVEGRLLSTDIFQGILNQSQAVHEEVEAMPDTVGEAAQAVANAWSRALSELDKVLDGTGRLARVLRGLERGLERFADAANPLSEFEKSQSQRMGEEIDALASERDRILQLLADAGPQLSGRIRTQAEAAIRRLNDQIYALSELANAVARAEQEQAGQADTPDAPDTPDPGAEDRRQKIDEMIASLEDEAATLDMNAEALVRYRLAALGATEADQARAAAAIAASDDSRRQQSIDEMIARLEDEAATVDMTAGEVALYRLQLLGASEAELTLARSAVEATEAMRQQQDDMARGQEIIEATRDVQARLNAEVAELVRLYEAGAFGAVGSFEALETLRLATVEAFKTLEEEGGKTFDGLTAAIKGWGDQFTNTLADMVADGKMNFSRLADSIIRDILRIMIYQQLTQPFLQGIGVLPAGNAQGGPVGFAEGGQIRGPGTPTSDSILIRASTGEYVMRAAAVRHYGEGFMSQINDLKAPKFATGGLVGLSTVPRFAEGGMVTGGGGGTGNVEVSIDNRGTPARVSDTEIDFQPDKMVVRVVLEDIDRNGPVSQRLSGAFGIRRRGG